MAWEMGGGWGHVGRLVPLARAFLTRSWRVSLVLQDLRAAHAWFDERTVTLLPAPRIRVDPELHLPTLNASSLLSEGGWLDAKALRSHLRAWHAVLDALRPDLVLCDYAPAAMLASRQFPGLPAYHVGSNFGQFVVGDPMPPLRWWDAGKAGMMEQCREHDALVLSVVNKVLRSLRWPVLAKIGELWPEDRSILCSIPPLDHGAKFGRPRHCWGVVENSIAGVQPPLWPDGAGEKAFVYLKPGMASTERILQALDALGLRCLVVVPNAPRSLVARFQSGRMRFSPPVDIPATLRQASLAVCNGTHGVCAMALAAGVPLLMSSYALEQRLNAVAVEEAGAGLRLDADASVADIDAKLRRLLHDASFRRAAQALAAGDWASKTSSQAADAIASHCTAAQGEAARPWRA